MSRTTRRERRARCSGCPWCHAGEYKRPYRRRARHLAKQLLRKDPTS